MNGSTASASKRKERIEKSWEFWKAGANYGDEEAKGVTCTGWAEDREAERDGQCCDGRYEGDWGNKGRNTERSGDSEVNGAGETSGECEIETLRIASSRKRMTSRIKEISNLRSLKVQS